ncbi:2-succinyl-5-enolpyruvyl-6-hydroxy-3-cyclohexene-1-carboxylic-acid synthase [Oceanobacillus iheyensis]|uniref:2-succinyl-5-enolpyruvyl-6-hydroxy-3- cyclohexene-1-carboxylic-acid synthase n=1 Tax=Oceanobacillus iheyensis TaxID=182710 RepID=UPI0036425FD2
MDYTEKLTRYVANFVDELAKSGVTDVVVSPGSRSTPLALVFTEHPSIKEWIIVDERSAAFFALGLAKKSNRAVAIVCTSGTAAANYYPAIVEAHYSRVPLLVLTADRPHELRHIGAPQTIEQIKMYGDYTKWFHEMAMPEASDKMLHYVRNKASHAKHVAEEGNPGVVHLNFPLREPLTPNFSLDAIWSTESYTRQNIMQEGTKQLTTNQLQILLEEVGPNKKGLFVCGPQADAEFADAVTSLAGKWGIPVVADPLSQLRTGQHHKDNVIDGYDAFLREAEIRQELKPDYIIRFGAMPVSKSYLFYVMENVETQQYVIEPNEGIRDHSSNQTTFLFADPTTLCQQLEQMTVVDQDVSTAWLKTWQEMNQIAKHYLLEGVEEQITEGEAVRGLAEVIPDGSTLYVGNSMAIRDVDTFYMTSPKTINILANRGANGIDGMVSSGVGASADNERVTLLLGDLSLFHDMNGLFAAKHYKLPITIVLINNNGGGIFSFLPQAKDKRHFEALFGTPMDLSFEQVAKLYEANYNHVKTEEQLKAALYESYQLDGLSIIEVKTDREQNVQWHQAKWQLIKEAILKDG